MSSSLENDLTAKIQKVLAHIDQHLDEPLSIEQLSEIAGLSKYHFHRQFTGVMGISMYKMVQLKRLRRAASQLVFRQDSIIDIALEAGFDSAEAFSRAFKVQFAQSPSQFRQHPQRKPWDETEVIKVIERVAELEVSIIELQPIWVGVLGHDGPMSSFYQTLQRFIQWRKQHRLPPTKSRTFNLLHQSNDDSSAISVAVGLPNEQSFNADLLVNNELGVTAQTISGGCYAVHRHTGSWDGLESRVNALFSQWLPNSGYQIRDEDLLLERLNLYPETPENELITDIYLPLKK
ncbi:GyrI-like domain-containing protein [Alteromonadaceae bacterium BrNp21-10]|nr:GyrI-like domain-containing protein [Alteromonadaceae bacterium BrNp21-10]